MCNSFSNLLRVSSMQPGMAGSHNVRQEPMECREGSDNVSPIKRMWFLRPSNKTKNLGDVSRQIEIPEVEEHDSVPCRTEMINTKKHVTELKIERAEKIEYFQFGHDR